MSEIIMPFVILWIATIDANAESRNDNDGLFFGFTLANPFNANQ